MLDADVRIRLGDLDLAAHLAVADGEVVALLGPNGAGKTTLVRAVAGLVPLDAGCIELDGRVLDDPSTGTFVPAEQRGVGVVFQDHLLFPRQTVLDNVAFGLRARGRRKADARADARRWLERLDLADLADARPAQLSGGQAQRAALARALVTEPALLLLDEPLAALDATTRADVRSELRRHLATFAGARLLVTHDPVDAIVLADRLVILEHGRITQVGSPAEVTARPASRFVADLVGLNLVEGEAAGERHVRLASGAELALADPVPADRVAVAIRPQAVALHRQPPEGSPRNHWAAVVVGVEGGADRVRVALDGPVPLTAEVTAASAAALGLRPGEQVWAAVKAVDLEVYPR
ncbi:MAG: ABC transporter ATP-binding protein [Acidimicrobiia bacterium]